jgi:hypothetical protein
MVIIFSDSYHLSIPAATATIVRTSTLVTTVHAISQTEASVKVYWSHNIMFMSIILKYWTAMHLRRLQEFRYNNIWSKLKPYCRNAKFVRNFLFLTKTK